ncbi:hypothetical protein SO802_026773 [Lithocarpus litseifolius]|uniref:Reverse transcriptase domain-containing protein n=1 Tax=Lithocarpus litseifolius TaxID=425828 RepID=A0AAW2C2P4_9ROSI
MHWREREGCNLRPEWQMKNFPEVVNRCNLRDIRYIGSDFTWCRRLASTSDHCILVLKAPRDRQRGTRRPKLFRFESKWLRDEGYKDVVTKAGVSAELIKAIQGKVTDRMNTLLLQDFQAQDVEKALKQMHSLKVPGPNDMPPIFYQHFWTNFHETHIVIIPKTKKLERAMDYRPISLCNVAYKLASKAVANCFKLVLQDIICENQSTFVSKRLITDNVLVAHELMNHINRKKNGRNGEMTLKLDMSKAYNHME